MGSDRAHSVSGTVVGMCGLAPYWHAVGRWEACQNTDQLSWPALASALGLLGNVWLEFVSQSPPVSPARTRAMLSALFADQQPSETFYKKSTSRPLAKTPRQKKFGGRPLPANVALRHDRGGREKRIAGS